MNGFDGCRLFDSFFRDRLPSAAWRLDDVDFMYVGTQCTGIVAPRDRRIGLIARVDGIHEHAVGDRRFDVDQAVAVADDVHHVDIADARRLGRLAVGAVAHQDDVGTSEIGRRHRRIGRRDYTVDIDVVDTRRVARAQSHARVVGLHVGDVDMLDVVLGTVVGARSHLEGVDVAVLVICGAHVERREGDAVVAVDRRNVVDTKILAPFAQVDGVVVEGMFPLSVDVAVLRNVETQVRQFGVVDPLARHGPRVGIFDPYVLQLEAFDVGHQDQETAPVGFLLASRLARIRTVAAAVLVVVGRGIEAQVAQPVARRAGVDRTPKHRIAHTEDGDIVVPNRIFDADTHVVAAKHVVAAGVGELQGAIVENHGHFRRQAQSLVDHPEVRAVGIALRDGDGVRSGSGGVDRSLDALRVAALEVVGRDGSPGGAECGARPEEQS